MLCPSARTLPLHALLVLLALPLGACAFESADPGAADLATASGPEALGEELIFRFRLWAPLEEPIPPSCLYSNEHIAYFGECEGAPLWRAIPLGPATASHEQPFRFQSLQSGLCLTEIPYNLQIRMRECGGSWAAAQRFETSHDYGLSPFDYIWREHDAEPGQRFGLYRGGYGGNRAHLVEGLWPAWYYMRP